MEISKRLTELSLSSMDNAKGKHFQPYEAGFIEPFAERLQFNEETVLKNRAFSTLVIPLKPVRDGTPVVAIDVSSIRIGETENGITCAVRGAIVWNEGWKYRYLRLGPFPFHITEESKRNLSDSLRNRSSSMLNLDTLVPFEAQRRLGNIVERWIQMGVSYSTKQSVILWDGSLTAGTPGNPVSMVSEILNVARRNSNSVLAISKATSIRFLGWRITDMVMRYEAPCVFEVEDLPISILKRTHLLGKIYVTKLARGGCPFRLDVDRALSREEGIRAVERLLGNELVFQGYPETLRLAHIYSTFTANDVIGVQSFITREYGLRVVTRPSIRRRLFGPFGTRFED